MKKETDNFLKSKRFKRMIKEYWKDPFEKPFIQYGKLISFIKTPKT